MQPKCNISIKERRNTHSQNEEPVRLVSHVSVSGPGFDLQPLGVTPLLSVQRLQQARCANVHRLKGAELQSEDLAKFLVIIDLERILKENTIYQLKKRYTLNAFINFMCMCRMGLKKIYN